MCYQDLFKQEFYSAVTKFGFVPGFWQYAICITWDVIISGDMCVYNKVHLCLSFEDYRRSVVLCITNDNSLQRNIKDCGFEFIHFVGVGVAGSVQTRHRPPPALGQLKEQGFQSLEVSHYRPQALFDDFPCTQNKNCAVKVSDFIVYQLTTPASRRCSY